MGEWKLKRDDGEWVIADEAELRELARDGRIRPQDYLFNPTLQQWMYAKDTVEVSSLLQLAPAHAPKKKTSLVACGCLTLIVLAVIVAFSRSTTSTLKDISESVSSSQAPPNTRASEVAALGPKGKTLCTKHPLWSASDCDSVAHGKIHIGMASEMVREAWGKPEKVNSTIFSGDQRHEQWVYGLGEYVYVENGVVTSIQQSR